MSDAGRLSEASRGLVRCLEVAVFGVEGIRLGLRTFFSTNRSVRSMKEAIEERFSRLIILILAALTIFLASSALQSIQVGSANFAPPGRCRLNDNGRIARQQPFDGPASTIHTMQSL